jgi:two-component system, LytTR family, sensor kinase
VPLAQVPGILSVEQYLLTTLFVKVAITAVLAMLALRSHRFRQFLLTKRPTWSASLFFACCLGIALAAGEASRILLGYNAGDLALEGAFLAGLIGGPVAGALVGAMITLPAVVAGEYLSIPFACGCGLLAGGIREVCPTEAIWRFSPLTFSELHKHVWHIFRRLRVDWQIILIGSLVGAELFRQTLGYHWPHRLFVLAPTSPLMTVLGCVASIMCVAAPIKIWNSARIEFRLAEQEQRLLQARLDALSRQINPHFLFNTLASIGSLVRTNPEMARTLILKLSSLLRRLLRSQKQFVPLREELASVDEYLDIEVVRFGPQLEVIKDIALDTLDVPVPSMLLQPLIENAIKHGISLKVGGGCIWIRCYSSGVRVTIEIEDNGVGMTPERLDAAMTEGIGLSNVDERLRVLYGDQREFRLTSTPNRGTIVRIELPVDPRPEQ